MHKHVACVLGNGMVVNPVNLVKEIDQMIALGVDISPERLIISTRAHLITPAHVALDKASETARGAGAIGTTLRGIGPAYLDKTGRQGVRAGEMLDLESYADTIAASVERANGALQQYGMPPLDSNAAAQEYLDAAVRLRPYIRDTGLYINARLREGARVLCEGAQGTMLDMDHGDYPYVTASTPTSGGALTGLGFGPQWVDRVVGVAKSFSTRVGAGPFPTELSGALAERLRGTGENFWDEFGTTTGRPRRCGWLDAVMLRYASQINGFTELVLTKLDVLSGLDEIKIAVAYDLDGTRYDLPPGVMYGLERIEPVYETFPGWQEDISGARRFEDLPPNARAYVTRIGELLNLPATAVSVGPEREQLVFC